MSWNYTDVFYFVAFVLLYGKLCGISDYLRSIAIITSKNNTELYNLFYKINNIDSNITKAYDPYLDKYNKRS